MLKKSAQSMHREAEEDFASEKSVFGYTERARNFLFPFFLNFFRLMHFFNFFAKNFGR